MEDLFQPVLVHNNRPGKDADLLKRFEEPSWNNPVIRYLDAREKDLIERKDGVWSTTATTQRMIAALNAANRNVPQYLSALATSEPVQPLTTATFAMHCYWEGEAKLGSIKGVSSTRSGWIDSLEVVTLKYDPSLVKYGKLIDAAKSFECASKVFTHSPSQLEIAKRKVGKEAIDLQNDAQIKEAKASDQKYYLLQTPLRHLPLSETQATKINSALKSGQPIESWLSPRQTKLLKRILAANKQDKHALQALQYPGKTSELAEYASVLIGKLNDLEEVSPPAK